MKSSALSTSDGPRAAGSAPSCSFCTAKAGNPQPTLAKTGIPTCIHSSQCSKVPDTSPRSKETCRLCRRSHMTRHQCCDQHPCCKSFTGMRAHPSQFVDAALQAFGGASAAVHSHRLALHLRRCILHAAPPEKFVCPCILELHAERDACLVIYAVLPPFLCPECPAQAVMERKGHSPAHEV